MGEDRRKRQNKVGEDVPEGGVAWEGGWSLDAAIRLHPPPPCPHPMWPQFGLCGVLRLASAMQQEQIQAAS